MAEQIYVTRQTISNWENERSYPDVQSLLLLSALFDVSLDELIKGDVQIMKNVLDIHKMNLWSWVMLISFALGAILILPMVRAFGVAGAIPSVVLILLSLGASLVLERIKVKNRVETYSEIVAFMEGREADKEKVATERQQKARTTAIKIFGSMAVGAVLIGISLLLEWLIFG